MLHPFCCVTPHNGVLCVIIIQTLAAALLIVDSIYNIYSSTRVSNESDSFKKELENIQAIKSAGIGMGVTWILYSLIHLGFAVILWKAKATEDQKKCLSRSRIWLISTSILTLVHLLLFLIALFCLVELPRGNLSLICIHISFILTMSYLLWAVGIYIHEVKLKEEEINPSRAIQYS